MQRAIAELWVDDTAAGRPAGDEPTADEVSADAEACAIEGVLGAALLAVTAFRLRDEAGLVAGLRALTSAIDALERRSPPA